MKVLLLNGSPRKAGCTYTALCEVAKALEKDGIETEIFYAGAPDKEQQGAKKRQAIPALQRRTLRKKC